MSSEMTTNGDSNMSIFERETTGVEQAEAEVEGKSANWWAVTTAPGRPRKDQTEGLTHARGGN
jgi:hypothetical protein